MLQDELNEYVYAAELAGLGYSLANTKCGITLSIKVRSRSCDGLVFLWLEMTHRFGLGNSLANTKSGIALSIKVRGWNC